MGQEHQALSYSVARQKITMSNNVGLIYLRLFSYLHTGSSRDIGTCLLKVSIHQKVIETQLKNFAR